MHYSPVKSFGQKFPGFRELYVATIECSTGPRELLLVLSRPDRGSKFHESACVSRHV